jgi:lysophospholipase L1-like esterase
MQALTVFRPDDVLNPGAVNAADLSSYGHRFLAQGDSWFSIGGLNLAKNSNLLFEMEFTSSRCAVNCGRTGSTLRRMVDQVREPAFNALLCGNQWRPWDGILLSAGGNDLIDALGHSGIANPAQRLFLLPAEVMGDPADANSYISAAGWATFSAYLAANFAQVIAMRQQRALNQGIPIFLHTYHYPTIRPAPAGPGLGPWLHTAAQSFAIPPAVWPSLTHVLYGRFITLLGTIASTHTNVHVFDSANLVPLQAAAPGSTGESGDWMNEIHLTWQGYEKVATAWASSIEGVLP